MQTIEKLIIDFLLLFVEHNQLFNALTDSRTVAIIVGALVAVSGALLGTFMLLRQMSLTTDAISHTVLLGIVVTFLVLTRGLNQEPDLTSPWLILGAALSGVVTVWLTELIFQSGLVKEDAALGLAFPFLFAIAVLLINQAVENVHLDQDAVWAGEIGLAFGKTNEYCFENCDEVTITPEHPKAQTGRECTNCGNQPEQPRNCRDDAAICEDYCYNCGTYSSSEAYNLKLTDTEPTRILFPKSISTLGLITLINVLFVVGLYKELKIATFDSALAASLGFRPKFLHYILMTLVSITAVGAFDAVGAILVVAFFVVPPATAYLLTDRLWLLLVLSAAIGALSAYMGYDLSRGNFLFIEGSMDKILEVLDATIGLDGYTTWDSSPSAAMVLMMGWWFTVAWIASPRYGLIASLVRQGFQQRSFAEQMVLIHLANHQGTEQQAAECSLGNLPEHLGWSGSRVQRVVQRLRVRQQVNLADDLVILTGKGRERVQAFYASRHQ